MRSQREIQAQIEILKYLLTTSCNCDIPASGRSYILKLIEKLHHETEHAERIT